MSFGASCGFSRQRCLQRSVSRGIFSFSGFFFFFFLFLFAVPSHPPQSVQAFNTSSTSVKVLWHSVPRGLVHGILRGYRIFYSKTKEFGVPMRQAVVPAHTRHVHLVGLEKFTKYSIQVAALTRIGVGAKSPELVVSTDEDGTYRVYEIKNLSKSKSLFRSNKIKTLCLYFCCIELVISSYLITRRIAAHGDFQIRFCFSQFQVFLHKICGQTTSVPQR